MQIYSENHYYHVVITEVDNGKEKVLHDANHGGMYALIDSVDGEQFEELVVHDSLPNIAQKLNDSKHGAVAARACVFANMFGKEGTDNE